MTKKIISLTVALHIIFCSAPAHLHAAGLPSGKSVLVTDPAGERLFARATQVKRAPASTIKLLTALVVMDELPLDSVVVVHRSVQGTQPSRINLSGGERFYTRDLLRALLIGSANDAARALAIAAGGSEYAFAKKMNQKAKALGARQSNFITPNGLPAKSQYSTAADLMIIFMAARQNSFIMRTLATKYASIRSLGGRRVHLKNHNKMLWRDSREMIGKTGWTRRAGHCFVGRIRSGNRAVYVSIFGSKKVWNDLTYIADHYLSRGAFVNASGNQEELSTGDRGSRVTTIQSALRRAGFFHQTPTGYFGPITRRAVIQFQRANNLEADGVVGRRTSELLNRYL